MGDAEPRVAGEEGEFGEECDEGRQTFEDQGLGRASSAKVDRQEEILPRDGVENGSREPEQRKMVDITRDKPVKVTVRVAVPVREHPKFNFVGKLLGPKGNSLKRLQEDTMTKMAILGRGSMKDKHKEEELRTSGDPKFCHLHDDLHVEITAFAPPAEAHARIAYALADVRRFLVPDYNDDIRQEQMWEMQILKERPDNLSVIEDGVGVCLVGVTTPVVPTLGESPSPSHGARSRSPQTPPSRALGPPGTSFVFPSVPPTLPSHAAPSAVSSIGPAPASINGRKRQLHSDSSKHSLSPTKRTVLSILSRARAAQAKHIPGYQITG